MNLSALPSGRPAVPPAWLLRRGRPVKMICCTSSRMQEWWRATVRSPSYDQPPKSTHSLGLFYRTADAANTPGVAVAVTEGEKLLCVRVYGFADTEVWALLETEASAPPVTYFHYLDNVRFRILRERSARSAPRSAVEWRTTALRHTPCVTTSRMSHCRATQMSVTRLGLVLEELVGRTCGEIIQELAKQGRPPRALGPRVGVADRSPGTQGRRPGSEGGNDSRWAGQWG